MRAAGFGSLCSFSERPLLQFPHTTLQFHINQGISLVLLRHMTTCCFHSIQSVLKIERTQRTMKLKSVFVPDTERRDDHDTPEVVKGNADKLRTNSRFLRSED